MDKAYLVFPVDSIAATDAPLRSTKAAGDLIA